MARVAALLLAAFLCFSLAFADESAAPAPAPAPEVADVPAPAPEVADAPAPAPEVSDAPAPAPAPKVDAAPTSTISSPAAAPGPDSLSYAPFDAVQDGVAVPMDEQAKDSQYLETNMAKAANQMEQFLQNVVEKRQKDSATDESTKECLSQCAEQYNSAVNSLKRGLVNANAKDFVKTSAELTAFTGNIDTCDDCFGDNGTDPEFQKFDEWVRGVGTDCLEKISKYVKAKAE